MSHLSSVQGFFVRQSSCVVHEITLLVKANAIPVPAPIIVNKRMTPITTITIIVVVEHVPAFLPLDPR